MYNENLIIKFRSMNNKHLYVKQFIKILLFLLIYLYKNYQNMLELSFNLILIYWHYKIILHYYSITNYRLNNFKIIILKSQ